MSTFSHVNFNDLEEVIQNLKSGTCPLDSIPTKVFKSVLHCFINSIENIINGSLQTGIFPASIPVFHFSARYLTGWISVNSQYLWYISIGFQSQSWHRNSSHKSNQWPQDQQWLTENLDFSIAWSHCCLWHCWRHFLLYLLKFSLHPTLWPCTHCALLESSTWLGG